MRTGTTRPEIRTGSVLQAIEPYIYGTMALNREDIPFDTRVTMARYAMDHCTWFHTSHKYGTTIDVLARAFKDAPSKRPRCTCKLSGDTFEEVRGQVDLQLKALGIEQITLGQLHVGEPLASELVAGGPCLDAMRKLRSEGKIGGWVLEVHPWTSTIALDHLRSGKGRDVIEGFSFYFNPLQRFALNDLFDLIVKERRPILALRTVGGGPADVQAARPATPGDYLRDRSRQVLPVYRASGYGSWVDFCMGFAYSRPGVVTTIGACTTPAHLDAYITGRGQQGKPFSAESAGQLAALQQEWSNAVDRFAAPWTM